jgi:hypothetical protein
MRPREEFDWEVRALFERRLDMPIVMHPYQAYEKAIALAHNPKYQQASLKNLEQLVDAHDDLIRSTFNKTVKRSIFRVVEFALPSVVTHSTGQPLVALAAVGLMKLVEARLPG